MNEKEIELCIKQQLPGFFGFDVSLPLLKKNKISSSYLSNDSVLLSYNIDIENTMMNSIKTEVLNKFMKDVRTELDVSNTDYVDIRGYVGPAEMYQATKKLIKFLNTKKYKSMIVGSKIAALIQDSFEFVFDSTDEKMNDFIIKIGSINNTIVFIDHYKKWDDDSIYMFDDIYINFNVNSIEVDSLSSFPQSRIYVEYLENIFVTPGEKIYVIDDDSSRIQEYERFMTPFIRDKKIDEIIF